MGLEDTEDLIEDLDQALKNAVGGKNCQVSCIGCSSYMFTFGNYDQVNTHTGLPCSENVHVDGKIQALHVTSH